MQNQRSNAYSLVYGQRCHDERQLWHGQDTSNKNLGPQLPSSYASEVAGWCQCTPPLFGHGIF